MRTVTYDEVVARAREAYDAGTLLGPAIASGEAPSDDIKTTGLYYGKEGSKFRCAIGASLNDEEIVMVQRKGLQCNDVTKLVDNYVIEFDDVFKVSQLQAAHDHWVVYLKNPKYLSAEKAERKRIEFLGLIGIAA